MKRIKKVEIMPHGYVLAKDEKGKDIEELCEFYSIDLHKRILLEALDDCELKGFEILPPSFIEEVGSWHECFAPMGMTWEDIQNAKRFDIDGMKPPLQLSDLKLFLKSGNRIVNYFLENDIEYKWLKEVLDRIAIIFQPKGIEK